MYTYIAKVERVVDGDTLEVLIDLGFGVFRRDTLRLARVDTAEIHGVKKLSEEYQKGLMSTQYVKDWVDRHEGTILIKTEKDKQGKYGRYIAEVFSLDESENLQDLLIQEGFDKNTVSND